MYYAALPESADVPDWKREVAMRQWQSSPVIEPPVMEYIVASTYRLTGERLWVARIYSSMFWLVGGWFLFLLAKEISSTDGAMIALLFYLFLPYGVIASRSFQPDPLMVALVIAGAWATYHWRVKEMKVGDRSGITQRCGDLYQKCGGVPVIGCGAGAGVGTRPACLTQRP